MEKLNINIKTILPREQQSAKKRENQFSKVSPMCKMPTPKGQTLKPQFKSLHRILVVEWLLITNPPTTNN